MATDGEKARRAQLRKAAGLKRQSELDAERAAKEEGPRLRRPAAYLVAYACFACRKSFKRAYAPEVAQLCPQCGAEAAFMGRGFKAPRLSERKQWEKVARLWQAGYRFHMNTRGAEIAPFPAKLSDVEAFMADHPRHPFRLTSHWPKD